MARKRMISPEFFMHYGLVEAEKASGLPLRIGFAGLWCQADKFGRFRWRPKSLKPVIFPYEDVDFAGLLETLEVRGFIRRYEAAGEAYGFIPSWREWQSPHHTERPSTIPAPVNSERRTVMEPLDNGALTVSAPLSNGGVVSNRAQGTDAVAVTDTDTVAVAVRAPPPPLAAPSEGAPAGWHLEGDPLISATRFCTDCGDGEQFVPPGGKREQTRHRATCPRSAWPEPHLEVVA